MKAAKYEYDEIVKYLLNMVQILLFKLKEVEIPFILQQCILKEI